jgi:putative tryptophan/tyrosine transport system substrate-binding protein
MKRRHFVAFLAAAGLPAATFGQSTKVWRVGVLMPRARPASLDSGITGAFLRGMRELAYVEGKNVRYELRFTEGKTEGLDEHAAQLVRSRVDVIVSGGTPPTRAAQKATSLIPIVMVYSGDPVGSGFVASLARPGGNITGITNINVDMNAKRVELLRSAFPRLTRVGALLNPANPTYAANLGALQNAASKAGVALVPGTARRTVEIRDAFLSFKSSAADAVIIQTDSLFATQARHIAELAVANRMPIVGGSREMVDAGALMSYSASIEWAYHRAAFYVDRILKGARPAEMPVEQPSKLELLINLKTVKALGVTLPSEVTFRADQLVQ